jgi:phage protein U
MLLALGSYRFSVNTAAFQQLSKSNDYRWAQQERLAVDPALQYIGPGIQTMDVQGVIFPHYKGGLNQVNDMRTEASLGKPLLLTDGQGNIHGSWVIERIEETQSIFFSNGTPRKIEFRVSLKKYDDRREN